VPYLDIDIPKQTRENIEYVVEGEETIDESGKIVRCKTHMEYRKAWSAVREFHMYQTFLNSAETRTRTLLICGLSHLPGFTRLFAGSCDIRDITPEYQFPATG
jgi:hypothetical protein